MRGAEHLQVTIGTLYPVGLVSFLGPDLGYADCVVREFVQLS